MWGQDELKNGEFSYMRIIPTRVGTRAGQEQVQHELRDHPHACGDKATYQDRHGDWHGSSPRVWGQDHRFRCYAVTYRIIPTRVGTSKKDYNLVGVNKDHPHACGDKFPAHLPMSAQAGSSPRVWGQGNMLCISPRGDRIIPTRVGTSYYTL